jgi:hypothetical protein
LDELENEETTNRVSVNIAKAYAEQEETRQWMKERRKAVDMLIKEKSKDPNMTSKKWNDRESAKLVTWR